MFIINVKAVPSQLASQRCVRYAKSQSISAAWDANLYNNKTSHHTATLPKEESRLWGDRPPGELFACGGLGGGVGVSGFGVGGGVGVGVGVGVGLGGGFCNFLSHSIKAAGFGIGENPGTIFFSLTHCWRLR